MKPFSQRKGYKSVREIIQFESMDEPLRAALWNLIDSLLWSRSGFLNQDYGRPEIYFFGKHLWANFFKQPVYLVPDYSANIMREITNYYFNCKWYEVYDFIEFIAEYLYKDVKEIYSFFNETLETEFSGYRFVDGHLTDITNEQEIEMLEEAVNDTQFKSVSTHLARALELYTDRINPDYRNSIKESISAVESMSKIVTNSPKATLADALKKLEKSGTLHKALKEGFEKLYAYTSDADGIRHSMLQEHNLTAADARYFLLSCTSFVGYLKTKISV